MNRCTHVELGVVWRDKYRKCRQCWREYDKRYKKNKKPYLVGQRRRNGI